MTPRRARSPLEDPSGLHAGHGRFLCDHKTNRVLFLPSEEAYYRAWCTHFGIDFDDATTSVKRWEKTFDELRRKYYATHPEIILAMERELADIPPLDRVLTIAARTQDFKRMHQSLLQIREQGVEVPEVFLSLGAD